MSKSGLAEPIDRFQQSGEASEQPRVGGRPAAGTDPGKRRQIMAGADAVFNRLGFDAASMNDIAREAGVSKGTLYVYFESKEELFVALLGEQRERHAEDLFAALSDDPDLDHALFLLAKRIATLLCQDRVITAYRIVISVTERMPAIGQRFFEMGPQRSALQLAALLETRAAAGEIRIEDSTLAAAQFLELAQAGLVRPRLFGIRTAPPDEAEVARVARAAVDMFMARYGRPRD